MSQTDEQRLGHILKACRLIAKYADLSLQADLESHEILIEGLIRQLEKIGEAAKNLSTEMREELDMVPWKDFMRTRDKLAHKYFDVDYEVVWKVMREEVPFLLNIIKTRFPALKESD